jgi:bromodomain-containing factor 1
MSAQEQEARIAQLEALSSMYKRPGEGGDVEVTQAPTPTNESSDESSSEEE